MPGGAGWPSRHPPAVSVNVSAEQLRSFGLARIVAGVLARDGLPASRLVLEVTESTALAADAETQAALAALREFGVSLAVDDFGTGYSSLTYLARLQVDLHKLNRAFLAGIDESPAQARLVGAVIQACTHARRAGDRGGHRAASAARSPARARRQPRPRLLLGRPMEFGELELGLGSPAIR
jgi:EAL domain-containing protein (putative c-di-GMP-specific phosphodiesterase class I)